MLLKPSNDYTVTQQWTGKPSGNDQFYKKNSTSGKIHAAITYL